jgi:hypothetical protein
MRASRVMTRSCLIMLRRVHHQRGVRNLSSGSNSSPPATSAKAATSSGKKPPTAASTLWSRTRDRGPVTWASLFLVGVAAASATAYFSIERERRLEAAMGKVVSSESDGWTPRPDSLAKRKFVSTKYGWFPVDDGYGACECVFAIFLCDLQGSPGLILHNLLPCSSGYPFF